MEDLKRIWKRGRMGSLDSMHSLLTESFKLTDRTVIE